MRDTVIHKLIDLGKKDKDIELITGDLGFGVLKPFWETLPDQFVNAGIAEQNMTGAAAGMALEGKKVFTYSIGIAADTNDSGIIYSIEDIAKCSDYILRYKVDASFAIAYIDQDTISISARSKGNIDISQIMKMFGGGGSTTSGAARVKGTTIKCIVDELTHILNPTATLSNENSVGKVLKLTK